MKVNYPASLAATLRYEGGYSNHPADPGGPTMKGITQRTYDGWRRKHGMAPRPVRQLAQDELEAIYRRDYWDVCKCDDLPGGADLAVFDFAVNSGPSRAVKYLQSVVGVPQDGVVGPRTIAAAIAKPNCGAALCDARLAFMKRLGTWRVFGKGWGDRMADVRKKVVAMAKASPAIAPPRQQKSKSVFDEVMDVIDWTRPHGEETAGPWVPQGKTEAPPDDGLHRYLLPAIVAFVAALAQVSSDQWSGALSDHSMGTLLAILMGAAGAAYQSSAPWWAKMVWRGPRARSA